MPWTGPYEFTRDNGQFTGTLVWTDDLNASVKITAAHHDNHDQDIADGFALCLRNDGGNSPTANISWDSKKITSLAYGSGNNDAAAYGQTSVSAALNPSTNVLTITKADGSTYTVDLSALAVGGSTTDFARYSNGVNPFSGSATFAGAAGVGIKNVLTILDPLTISGATYTWSIAPPTSTRMDISNTAGAVLSFSGNSGAATLSVNGSAVWTAATLPASTFSDVLTASGSYTITGGWIWTAAQIFGNNLSCRAQFFLTDALNNGYRIKNVASAAPLTEGMEISGLGSSVGVSLGIGLDGNTDPQAYIASNRLWSAGNFKIIATAAPTGGDNDDLALVLGGANQGLWHNASGTWTKIIAGP